MQKLGVRWGNIVIRTVFRVPRACLERSKLWWKKKLDNEHVLQVELLSQGKCVHMQTTNICMYAIEYIYIYIFYIRNSVEKAIWWELRIYKSYMMGIATIKDIYAIAYIQIFVVCICTHLPWLLPNTFDVCQTLFLHCYPHLTSNFFIHHNLDRSGHTDGRTYV
jgi:hypothetical protein